jgi:hypothetical protein
VRIWGPEYSQRRTSEPVRVPDRNGGPTDLIDEVPKQGLKHAGDDDGELLRQPGTEHRTSKVDEALTYFNLAVRLEKPKALGAAR